MRTRYLDVLDLMDEYTEQELKSLFVRQISQQDLYKIATWLMMHLTRESQGTEHKRSQIRSLLQVYYQNRLDPEPWTPKQKYFVGYAVINLWQYRQLECDPRYII